MKYVTIKRGCQDGEVALEVEDMDTYGIGGYTVPADNLWGWLQACRPCVVQLRGRQYTLQDTGARARQPVAVMYG
jgi:hypothetical protein